MGVDEGNIQIMDVEMIIENRPITIPRTANGSGMYPNIEKKCCD